MSPFEGAFDYIILGAGSAGCILAATLAEALPDDRILLLEAGDDIPPHHETVWDPTRWVLVSRDRTLEWGYRSVAQTGLHGREIQLRRAKALGGCSVHNAMVYVRGGAYGFDRWAQEGCVGWNYDNILPYFERVEERMHITQAAVDPFIEDLVVACNPMGIPYTPNYNTSPHAFGVSPFQFLISQGGQRETTFSNFLGTGRHKNLHIASGVRFDRIVFDGERRAVAVAATDLRTQRQVEIHASREILIAAGAIGSPHLLLLSGVGPENQLRDLGIPVVSALPGVGENFQDDLFVTAMFLSRKPMPPQPYGLMGAVIFTSTDPSTLPYLTDVECSLASGTMEGLELPPDKRQSYFIYPNLQLLRSRGTIKLASTNPAEHPIIDPRYLNAPEDIQRCIFGVKLARDIGHNRGLADWFAEEILPGPRVQTDAEIEAYIRQTADTCYHYAGTCKMGVDDMAVVTPNLEVRGTERLRVVDASIIPTTVSGNTAAATMMIAAKGADLVLASRRST
ncbi:GMC family oxidoreductase [Polyangium jinanense]|uniref:GMC family oxidoreductase N-terminal domain-containing protein n=1 Tax=Polyangium jinanense TaxID=2829994 RepID=A0A9X4AXG5_9BACT|nr:GMC family oxidoreductase N-terminal domain-containing protein [Polyangium jinanense]MDC3960009.1 GMC family oxidoreductase N-terminal domain-containing protein [Polyangium jinanense]MDC3986227.1 GMC family oxidoreductase N-terminal domain-containing protein [Polyangium jinanense]